MTVVGRVMAAVAVVAGSIVLGGSAQAAVVTRQIEASGEITSPSDGQVITQSSVTVSARTGLMQLKMGLYVDGPSTPSRKVAGGGSNQTISGTFDAGSAPNGTFTVTLKGEITGAKYATSTFKLRQPPEKPGNVNARLKGNDKVEMTWSKGSEPDLQSYEVSTSQSGIVGRLSVDNACSGSSCKATLAVPAKAAGHRVSITVKAFRGDGDGGSVGSGNSGAAYVTVPAPKTSQPKKQTTRQPSKTDDKKAVEPLPTLPGKTQAKPTTVPTRKPTTHKSTSVLPATPDTHAKGDLLNPTATDDKDGTGGLPPSGTDKGAKDDSDSTPVQVGGVKAQADDSPMGNIGQYGIYVACGLLLLLLAVHFGAWARRRTLASADGSGGVPVAAGGGSPSRRGGASAHQAGDRIPSTATASRRPTVVLAVARTRIPEPGQERPEISSSVPVGESTSSAHGSSGTSKGADGGRGATTVVPERALGTTLGSGSDEVLGVPGLAFDTGPEAPASISGKAGVQERGASDPVDGGTEVSGLVRGHVPTALPMYLGVHDLRGTEAGRQEPVRISLPSSAVTDVPKPSTPVIPAAEPLEDRWDDYLPPSPRAMEDSGFWERPQPGAGDFWAADDDERAYVGHRHKDGES